MSISTYTLFSDAAVETALDAVGGEMMGTQDTELLKQIFVAAGNGGGGGGGTGLTIASDVTASATLAVNTSGLVSITSSANVVLTLPTGSVNDVIERRVEIAAGALMTLSFVSGSTLFTYDSDGSEAVGYFQFTRASSGWKATGLNLIGVQV